MEDIQIDLYTFLGVLEVAFILLVVALTFIIRSKGLAGRMQVLQRRLKEAEAQEPAAAVSFAQYLRDEIIRNQALIERAAASDDDAEKKAAELLKMRNRFLELEVEVRELENNPVQFQNRLAAGMSELIEQLRPEPETVTEAIETADEQEMETEDDIEQDAADERATIDTRDAEFNRLKDVINNQQDAMAALRRELEAHKNDIEDADSVMRKLEEFEQQSTELQQCLYVLEQENERLKVLRAAGGDSTGGVDADAEAVDTAQLGNLKSMMGQQQETISNLQNLIRELAPEAGKAKELEDSINSITRTSQELSGCVAVLEDENAMLRGELEQIQVQLEQQAAQQEALEQEPALQAEPGITLDDTLEAEPGEHAPDTENQELEIKVQELEALVEFKDAAIEELEKQYHALEAKYRAVSGEKDAN